MSSRAHAIADARRGAIPMAAARARWRSRRWAMVSAVAGIPLGRYLDRRGPRGLMTAGSLVATLLVLAWSRVEDLVAFYAAWIARGLTMAAVLCEAAFTVLAKHFTKPAERRRAMTAMTLVAALASFIFVPLAQAARSSPPSW